MGIICDIVSLWTALNNVCACARYHGLRSRQRPGHHTKPRENGGVFKKFRMMPGLWSKGRATLKTVERNLYTSFLDHNLVPRAHVSFGQRQDTELWNNQLRESKILGLPVSRRVRTLV